MTALLAVLMALIIIGAVVAYRKRTAPAKVPPLHPSLLLVSPSKTFYILWKCDNHGEFLQRS
jgi:hypothetical protein